MIDNNSDSATVSNGQAQLTTLASLGLSLHESWLIAASPAGQSINQESAAYADAQQFISACPQAANQNVGWAPGTYAAHYVDAIGQHLIAVCSILQAGGPFVSLWPLVRAELEIAGRVAWLLDPGVHDRAGEKRVARFYLEALSSIQRERCTAGKINGAHGKAAKRLRDALSKEIDTVFPDAITDFSLPLDELDEWVIGGESLMPLGKAVQQFAKANMSRPEGLYDILSDYSHPSLFSILHQTDLVESDGQVRRPYRNDPGMVEYQAEIACLVFYRAAHYVLSYWDLDADSLEQWADTAPERWFTNDC